MGEIRHVKLGRLRYEVAGGREVVQVDVGFCSVDNHQVHSTLELGGGLD